VLIVLYEKYKTKTSTASTAQSASTVNQPGGVDSSLVPQFINQTYNQETPPNVTVNTTVPVTSGTDTDTTPPPTSTPPPKTTPPPEKITYSKYTVRPGDTLQSLSQKFGVSLDMIADAPGNVYVKGEVPGDKKVGQQLGTGAGLKTGMVLNIPHVTPG
jgi:LysM repeat protein